MKKNKRLRFIIRLPNWLGDLVMSFVLVKLLKQIFPTAKIDVIVKSGLSSLLGLVKGIDNIYAFDKQKYNSLFKIRQYAKTIEIEYDFFICLPNSFSSAFMGYYLNTKERIGYKNEFRSALLSKAITKPKNLHRVESYCELLKVIATNYNSKMVDDSLFNGLNLLLEDDFSVKKKEKPCITLNLVSVDDRRTFDESVSVKIIEAIFESTPNANLYILGTEKAKRHFKPIKKQIKQKQQVVDLTAKTTLPQLAAVLQNADLLISTDSGPAHLANCLNTPTIVYFGVGNAAETSPYIKEQLAVLNFNEVDKAELSSFIQQFIG